MKKTLITIILLSTFSYAEQYNAVIGKEHNKYTDINYLPTGEITCHTFSPLENEVYKDKTFTQTQSDCLETYRSSNGSEKFVSVEDRTEEILGTLVLSDCKSILNQGHSDGDGYYTINSGGSEFETICDMTVDGGGWTLIASLADDGQDYWDWDSISYLYNGNVFGDVKNINSDYQNAGWANIIADDVLMTDTNKSKYMIYDTMLNNEPMKNEHYAAQTTSPEYTPRLKHGSWWFDSGCDNGVGYMRTSSPDSDSNAWLEGAKGFIWRSVNNDSCNYDDTIGSLNHAYPSYTHQELGWNGNGFYHQNFNNDALVIWVR